VAFAGAVFGLHRGAGISEGFGQGAGLDCGVDVADDFHPALSHLCPFAGGSAARSLGNCAHLSLPFRTGVCAAGEVADVSRYPCTLGLLGGRLLCWCGGGGACFAAAFCFADREA